MANPRENLAHEDLGTGEVLAREDFAIVARPFSRGPGAGPPPVAADDWTSAQSQKMFLHYASALRRDPYEPKP